MERRKRLNLDKLDEPDTKKKGGDTTYKFIASNLKAKMERRKRLNLDKLDEPDTKKKGGVAFSDEDSESAGLVSIDPENMVNDSLDEDETDRLNLDKLDEPDTKKKGGVAFSDEDSESAGLISIDPENMVNVSLDEDETEQVNNNTDAGHEDDKKKIKNKKKHLELEQAFSLNSEELMPLNVDEGSLNLSLSELLAFGANLHGRVFRPVFENRYQGLDEEIQKNGIGRSMGAPWSAVASSLSTGKLVLLEGNCRFTWLIKHKDDPRLADIKIVLAINKISDAKFDKLFEQSFAFTEEDAFSGDVKFSYRGDTEMANLLADSKARYRIALEKAELPMGDEGSSMMALLEAWYPRREDDDVKAHVVEERMREKVKEQRIVSKLIWLAYAYFGGPETRDKCLELCSKGRSLPSTGRIEKLVLKLSKSYDHQVAEVIQKAIETDDKHIWEFRNYQKELAHIELQLKEDEKAAKEARDRANPKEAKRRQSQNKGKVEKRQSRSSLLRVKDFSTIQNVNYLLIATIDPEFPCDRLVLVWNMADFENHEHGITIRESLEKGARIVLVGDVDVQVNQLAIDTVLPADYKKGMYILKFNSSGAQRLVVTYFKDQPCFLEGVYMDPKKNNFEELMITLANRLAVVVELRELHKKA